MKFVFTLAALFASLSLFGQPGFGNNTQASNPGFATNETHVLGFTTTNALWINGAGTVAANSVNAGPYILKTPGGAFSIYTNTSGTFGINYDPGALNLPTEGQLTNSAGVLQYHVNAFTSFPAGTWITDAGGTAPPPVSTPGTNFFTNTIVANYPNPGAFGKILNTNYYFCNALYGNDTNAVPGVRDRPYQYLTNLLINIAIHSNDVIYLEQGTNYFGSVSIQLSNGVSIIGLGNRDQCWIAKDPSKVDVGDVNLAPGIGSLFQNFSGNVTANFSGANVTLRNIHLIGYIDCFLPTGTSNLVVDGCIFEVNAADTSPLIDAGVINSAASTFIKDSIFISKRRGNGATTRRGLAIKGGTNLLTGDIFIATDSTNNAAGALGCVGLWTEGNGYTYVAGCISFVNCSNANNYIGYTNAFVASGTTLTAGPFSLLYTNGSVTFHNP